MSRTAGQPFTGLDRARPAEILTPAYWPASEGATAPWPPGDRL